MAVLSDDIESFILTLMQDDGKPVLVLQRNELAEYFRCAPSQINYVLSTRFTVDQGYVIESRRGGGGYIRISKMQLDKNEYLGLLLREGIGDTLREDDAYTMLKRIRELNVISDGQFNVARSMLSNQALTVPSPIRERVRAGLMRALVIELAKHNR